MPSNLITALEVAASTVSPGVSGRTSAMARRTLEASVRGIPLGVPERTLDLIKVATAVDFAPADNFNMMAWCDNNGRCGTRACAIGWFCLRNPYDDLRLVYHPGDLMQRYGARIKLSGVYEGLYAVAKRFDIPFAVATVLFDSNFQPHFEKQEVADRIRKYVRAVQRYDPKPIEVLF